MEVNGHGDLGEYGKLFGAGGWFQKTFRPGKFADFQATNPTADLATTTATGADAGKEPFWKRIFRRDPAKVAQRDQRRAGRRELRAAAAGGAQFSDPSGKWRYVSNADGTYQVFKKSASGWKRVRSDVGPGDGSMFTAIDSLARQSGAQAGQPGSRGAGWAEAAAGLASAEQSLEQ